MASIYDIDGPVKPPTKEEKKEAKRSKSRPDELTSSEIRAGKMRLLEMVETSFKTLEDAMLLADFPTAVKAAQIILDRTGFGPKSTVDVNAVHTDLSELTREQLAERAATLAARIKERQATDPLTPESPAAPGVM